jgi:hypothetical protein
MKTKLNIISITVHCKRVKRRLPEKEDNKYTGLERHLWVIHRANTTPACISTTRQKKQKTRREKRGQLN